MKSGFRLIAVLMLIISLVALPSMAMAKWSGAQTITWELHNEWRTIFTSVLNYEAQGWLHVTLVLDRHPIYGTDIDLSSTVYLPFWNVLYSTVGVRRGLFASDTPTVPYVSVTVGF